MPSKEKNNIGEREIRPEQSDNLAIIRQGEPNILFTDCSWVRRLGEYEQSITYSVLGHFHSFENRLHAHSLQLFFQRREYSPNMKF